LEEIIADEKPDGILLGFGGQTALNCFMELAEKGILKSTTSLFLGTGIIASRWPTTGNSSNKTMLEKAIPVPKSGKASTVEAAWS